MKVEIQVVLCQYNYFLMFRHKIILCYKYLATAHYYYIVMKVVSVEIITIDKRVYQINIFFFILHENICCGYSLEAPRRGASYDVVFIRSALPRRF